MDSIARTAGVGGIIQLGGRSLSVRGRVLRHMAEIEAEIIRRRGNPFDLVRQANEALRADQPELVALFTAQAFQQSMKWRFVTLDDIDDFLGSTWGGRCMRLWLAVRDNDRDTLTLDRVTQMFADEFESIARSKGKKAAYEWQERIDMAIDQADGSDELGNSNGSPKPSEAVESTAEAGAAEMATASESPGT